jgi:hypothetical protein
MKTTFRIAFAIYLLIGLIISLDVYYEVWWLDHNKYQFETFPLWIVIGAGPAMIFFLALDFIVFWVVVIALTATIAFYAVGSFWSGVQMVLFNAEFCIDRGFDVWGLHEARRERLRA